MIPPVRDALSCEECHSRNGRLRELGGFYMPGRDRHLNLDRIGWLSCLVLLVMACLHGALRFITARGKKKQ